MLEFLRTDISLRSARRYGTEEGLFAVAVKNDRGSNLVQGKDFIHATGLDRLLGHAENNGTLLVLSDIEGCAGLLSLLAESFIVLFFRA
jgi:hypothetical protein